MVNDVVRERAQDPQDLERLLVSRERAGDVEGIRLWPLPAEGPPIHTLPIGDLLDRLRSFTNFRVARDDTAAGGYRLDFEPFTGWKRKPPSW
jgi:hypothetical protein